MHRFPDIGAARPPSLEKFVAIIASITSDRQVRPVVTPSGQRARGNFPSIKAPLGARYESLVEKRALRLVEVCSFARRIATHPMVLDLSLGADSLHYTPDIQVLGEDAGALVEVKARYFLSQSATRVRMRRVIRRLRDHGLELVLILDTDIDVAGLQTELAKLLRQRPIVGRSRPRLDTSVWDPLSRGPEDLEVAARWAAAQRECDALLTRVMRRNPDDLLDAAEA